MSVKRSEAVAPYHKPQMLSRDYVLLTNQPYAASRWITKECRASGWSHQLQLRQSQLHWDDARQERLPGRVPSA